MVDCRGVVRAACERGRDGREGELVTLPGCSCKGEGLKALRMVETPERRRKIDEANDFLALFKGGVRGFRLSGLTLKCFRDLPSDWRAFSITEGFAKVSR